MRKAAVRLSVELLKALEDCINTISKLKNLLDEDRDNMPDCINGEILKEYLRGTEGVQEILVSMMESLHAILADRKSVV